MFIIFTVGIIISVEKELSRLEKETKDKVALQKPKKTYSHPNCSNSKTTYTVL